MELPFAGSPGAYLATLLFSLAGSCVPFLNIEAFLIAVATALPRTSTLILAAAAALGQMAGKWLVYLAGAGLLRLRRRGEARARDIAARLARAPRGPAALVLVSALTGLPPLYAVSVAAGALRVRLGAFLSAVAGGAFLRFAVLLELARFVTP